MLTPITHKMRHISLRRPDAGQPHSVATSARCWITGIHRASIARWSHLFTVYRSYFFAVYFDTFTWVLWDLLTYLIVNHENYFLKLTSCTSRLNSGFLTFVNFHEKRSSIIPGKINRKILIVIGKKPGKRKRASIIYEHTVLYFSGPPKNPGTCVSRILQALLLRNCNLLREQL